MSRNSDGTLSLMKNRSLVAFGRGVPFDKRVPFGRSSSSGTQLSRKRNSGVTVFWRALSAAPILSLRTQKTTGLGWFSKMEQQDKVLDQLAREWQELVEQEMQWILNDEWDE